jgi:hypothetical protein
VVWGIGREVVEKLLCNAVIEPCILLRRIPYHVNDAEGDLVDLIRQVGPVGQESCRNTV